MGPKTVPDDNKFIDEKALRALQEQWSKVLDLPILQIPPPLILATGQEIKEEKLKAFINALKKDTILAQEFEKVFLMFLLKY